MEIEVAVFSPVSRLVALFVLTDVREVSDHNRSNTIFNTSLYDVFRERVEVVGATLRFLVVQPGSLLGVRIVTASDPLAEVVVVLFQAVERVQLAVTVFVGECGEVSDAEINAHRLFTRGFRHIDLDFTHEVQLPLLASPDGPDLPDVLHTGEVNIGPHLVLTEGEVRPARFQIGAFRESDAIVLGVEFEASGFERDRGTRMVVAVFPVAGRVRSRVSVAPFAVPTVERLSEFLKDSLT